MFLILLAFSGMAVASFYYAPDNEFLYLFGLVFLLAALAGLPGLRLTPQRPGRIGTLRPVSRLRQDREPGIPGIGAGLHCKEPHTGLVSWQGMAHARPMLQLRDACHTLRELEDLS